MAVGWEKVQTSRATVWKSAHLNKSMNALKYSILFKVFVKGPLTARKVFGNLFSVAHFLQKSVLHKTLMDTCFSSKRKMPLSIYDAKHLKRPLKDYWVQ
jgi:hypothetical protein